MPRGTSTTTVVGSSPDVGWELAVSPRSAVRTLLAPLGTLNRATLQTALSITLPHQIDTKPSVVKV